MSTAVLTHEKHAGHAKAPPEVCRFGMITFLASEAMLFGGLIGGYIVLRLARGEPWPPAGAPDIGVQWPLSGLNLVMIGNTIVLLGSSFLFRPQIALKRHLQGTAVVAFVANAHADAQLCEQLADVIETAAW